LWRSIPASAEDDGKDGEERHRQYETQSKRSAVAAQRGQGGADDGEDQSRSSLPVQCRNTDSRLGLRSETSTSSCPALAAASSNPAISVACSMVNRAVPLSKTPPRSVTQASTLSSEVPKRANTSLREAKALRTSSSFVPRAIMRP